MTLRFYTLDVFTATRFGGNPLAVVLEADNLPTPRLQQIAREFNLSETVFIQRPTLPDALVRARIFTPAKELPFAGHPTVGTACLLAELGLAPQGREVSFVLEEGVGAVPVRVRREPGQPVFGQLTTAVLPEYGPPAPPVPELAAMLGLSGDDLVTNSDRPRTASCGLPYVLVPVRTRETLSRIRFDTARWRPLLAKAWADHVLAYTHDETGLIHARMFAPGSGVFEDPATGSAAVALAGALAKESAQADGTLTWTIEQGVDLGRPSTLYAEADKRGGQVTAVRVGGAVVRVTEGLLHVSSP
jgi:trans-2,3-dihydro-3-hydroxyanthranilate isomerase